MECHKKFYSTTTAKAALHHGCPRCSGVDIDLYLAPTPPPDALPAQYKRGRSVLFKV